MNKMLKLSTSINIIFNSGILVTASMSLIRQHIVVAQGLSF